MTADELLQNVKDRAGLPTGITALSDTKILNAATEEMQALIAPLLESCGEDYFTTTATQSLSITAFDRMTIPEGAIGATVRKVEYLGTDGRSSWVPLTRLELSKSGAYFTGFDYPNDSTDTSATPEAFYLRGSDVIVVPAPNGAGGYLRVWYARRPSALVSDVISATQHTQVGIIASTNLVGLTWTITLNANHNNWMNGRTIVVTGARAPFRFKVPGLVAIGGGAGTATFTVTVSAAAALIEYGVAVGDYVTLENTSFVPQIPFEWHSLLELRACARVAAVLGKSKLQAECLANAREMQTALKKISAPRAQLNPRKISAWG